MEAAWTKDKTQCYYQGEWNTLYWPVIKAVLLVTLFLMLRWIGTSMSLTLAIVLSAVLFSQNVIAFCFGLSAVPAMDQATFLGQSKAVSNFSNSAGYSNPGDRDMMKARLAMMMKLLPKMRNCIVTVAGDYYYKTMSAEETLEKGLV